MLRLSFVAIALAVVLFVSACGGPARTGTRPDSKIGADPISHVEIVISGLSRSDAEAFRGKILAQGDIADVVLKSYADNVATYELDVRGCECDLPAKIARIQSPGFKYEGRTTQLKYSAFDNLPPVLVFIHPEIQDRELLEADQSVLVEVRDSDIEEVKINGVKAERWRGDVFLAHVRLNPGDNEIRVEATDRAGNREEAVRRARLRRGGDPSLQVLVEGKVAPGSTVLIDGREIPVDARGQYSVTIPIKPGQKQIEVIAIAPDGKKAVTVKELGK